MNSASPLSGALLAFCINQGISASFLSPILLTEIFSLSHSISIYFSRHAVHTSVSWIQPGLVPGSKRDTEVPDVTQEKHQVFCHNSRKTRRFSPQCEMRASYDAASLEKSDLHSWASKGSLTPLRQLKKFPDISVSSWETTSVYHKQEESRFSLLISRWGSISLLRWERNPGIRITPQEEAVSTWNLRGTTGVVPQFRKTSKFQSTPDTTDSHGPIRLSPSVSTSTQWQVWQPYGTSRGNPRTLCPLDRKADSTFTAWEESGLGCLHMRRRLTPLLKLCRNPEIHVSTGEEHWAPGLSCRWGPRTQHRLEGNLEGPLATRMETGLPWGNMSGSLRSSS